MSFCSTSSPSIPGSLTSSSTRSTAGSWACSSPEGPSSASRVFQPSKSRANAISSRTARWSSTIKTVAWSVMTKGCSGPPPPCQRPPGAHFWAYLRICPAASPRWHRNGGSWGPEAQYRHHASWASRGILSQIPSTWVRLLDGSATEHSIRQPFPTRMRSGGGVTNACFVPTPTCRNLSEPSPDPYRIRIS